MQSTVGNLCKQGWQNIFVEHFGRHHEINELINGHFNSWV